MSRNRLYVILALLAGAVLLAFLLQDVIHNTLIVPIQYLWWALTLTYRSVAQLIFWALLVVAVALMALGSLYGRITFRPKKNPKHIPSRGPVETMAWWLSQAPRGNYFKWRVANRLGELAEQILSRGDEPDPLPGHRLKGIGWDPPAGVRRYLEAGLNSSFAEYPRKGWFSPPLPTPFDLDVEQVIAYLETQMESRSDRRRS